MNFVPRRLQSKQSFQGSILPAVYKLFLFCFVFIESYNVFMYQRTYLYETWFGEKLDSMTTVLALQVV